MSVCRLVLWITILLCYGAYAEPHTLLNVGKTMYGAKCQASSERNQSYSCENLLDDDTQSTWETAQAEDINSVFDTWVNVTLWKPDVLNMLEITKLSNRNNIPNIIVLTLGDKNGRSVDKTVVVPLTALAVKVDLQEMQSTINETSWAYLSILKADNLSTEHSVGFAEIRIFSAYQTVQSENGEACVFPFIYQGETRYSCTPPDDGGMAPVCQTKSGTFEPCVFPLTKGCVDIIPSFRYVIGPQGVEEAWCRGQGGCYQRAEKICMPASHSCLAGRFGTQCERKCNCKDDADGCDIVSGKTKRCQCLDGHLPLGPVCEPLRAPSVSMTHDIVNSGQNSTITCKADGMPTPNVTLISDGTKKNIVMLNTKTTQSEITSQYQVQLFGNEKFICIAKNALGDRLDHYVAQTHKLATLKSPPTAYFLHNNSVLLQWLPWNLQVDHGEGPVIGYSVLMEFGGESRRVFVENQFKTNALLETIQPGLNYSFSLSCVRPGEGGLGPPGPAVSLDIPTTPFETLTNCDTSKAEVAAITLGVIMGVLLVLPVVAMYIIFRKSGTKFIVINNETLRTM